MPIFAFVFSGACVAHAEAVRIFLGNDDLKWDVKFAKGESRIEPDTLPPTNVSYRYVKCYLKVLSLKGIHTIANLISSLAQIAPLVRRASRFGSKGKVDQEKSPKKCNIIHSIKFPYHLEKVSVVQG